MYPDVLLQVCMSEYVIQPDSVDQPAGRLGGGRHGPAPHRHVRFHRAGGARRHPRHRVLVAGRAASAATPRDTAVGCIAAHLHRPPAGARGGLCGRQDALGGAGQGRWQHEGAADRARRRHVRDHLSRHQAQGRRPAAGHRHAEEPQAVRAGAGRDPVLGRDAGRRGAPADRQGPADLRDRRACRARRSRT